MIYNPDASSEEQVNQLFEAIAHGMADEFTAWMEREGYLSGGAHADEVDERVAKLMALAWMAGRTGRRQP